MECGVGVVWGGVGAAGYSGGCSLELDRGTNGEKKEAVLGLGIVVPYVVDMVGVEQTHFRG